MKEHPILFSTPMVQAKLEGRKTKTRRTANLSVPNESPYDWVFEKIENNPEVELFKNFKKIIKKLTGVYAIFRNKKNGNIAYCHFPYGQPGDLLWVRETWQTAQSHTFYLADGESQSKVFKWRPSIHMTKAAARIWLQVKEIRVERLQDISEEDAVDEGIKYNITFNKYECPVCDGKGHKGAGIDFLCEDGFYTSAKKAFKALWISINGIESWFENPWVWVVKFKVLSTTGKPQFCSSRGNMLVKPFVPGVDVAQ